MIEKIEKSKFIFVNQESKIVDKPLETKEIGYYKDAWNRFKKNRVSVAALIIISIILFFIIIGPHLKNYQLYTSDKTASGYFDELTPKIPLLEKLGIFDGSRTITKNKAFLEQMDQSEEGKGIIKKILSEEENGTQLRVVVDSYRYKQYIRTYVTEDETIPSFLLTKTQYDEALEKNAVVAVINVQTTRDANSGQVFYTYQVQLDPFNYFLNQTPEDTYFWFGTTLAGADLFTELWKGARISLIMAVLVVVINAIIGLFLGSIAGYYGGTFDLLFDRVVDILGSLPFLAVLSLLIIRFGTTTGVILVAFTMTGWIGSYGSGRMQFYRYKGREYVLSARSLGAKDSRVMFKHILPNALGTLITSYALSIPSFIFSEATYSYLGIMTYSNATSVGELLSIGQTNMTMNPHLLLFPAFYISILMLAFNLFGNGLRDAFNPSLRGVE